MAPVGGRVEVRPARAEDLPEVLAFLQTVGARRQFFPCYRADDFFTPHGAFRDLRPSDLLLAHRSGRLIGLLGGWDQYAFRQTVVHSYATAVRWMRPLYNAWAGLRGRPRLPRPGKPFRYLTAALPLVADDDPSVFAALLDTLRERVQSGPYSYLMLGLHEADPLLAVARMYRAVRYTTRLYLVCWPDGETLRTSLDARPPYLELGSL